MNPQEQTRKINKVIARAWLDDGFRKQLLADPTMSLRGEGVEVPAGVEVRIAEDTKNVVHLVLPAKPSTEELSDETLAQAVTKSQSLPGTFAPTAHMCNGGGCSGLTLIYPPGQCGSPD